jgi:probable rRNA maturation factor
MKMLNLHYRKVACSTDVISFPIYRSVKEIPYEQENLLGDIVINLAAAERQSRLYRSTFYGEVRRLLVHGFLHLLGYDHEKSIYGKRKMEKKERALQDALASMD